jgi:phage regulator Rha-like protein
MSNREIADLTGKRPDHVARDIRDMLAALYDGVADDFLPENILKNQQSPISASGYGVSQYGVNAAGVAVFEYRLDKDHTLTLMAGYDVKARMKIIKRWQELEEKIAAQASKVATALTWEQQRQAGKEVRANFTDTLKEHDVSGYGFAQCTNGIYRPLFGATASKLKQERGLAKQDSLRDAMSGEELIASAFAEIVASQRMDANEDQGNSPCYNTCKSSGQDVRGLLVKKLD